MWTAASTEALALSIKVALVATAVILLVGTPLTYWMARRRKVTSRVVELLLTLPLVVPPVVTGYVLLLALGPRSVVGRWLEAAGVRFTFDWKGAVVAAMVMAMPVFLAVAKVAFLRCDRELEEAARTLNAGPLRVFFTVTLPLAGPGLLAAAGVAFARAFGEFGATMLLAGNIPAQTRTVPQAIYVNLLAGDDRGASGLVLVSILVGVAAMVLSQVLTRQPAPSGEGRSARAGV
ncbi:MAG: molybdate ABC transporter permease subunit [Planctomycetota bacterium]|jgi:molybdate transport system permease protein